MPATPFRRRPVHVDAMRYHPSKDPDAAREVAEWVDGTISPDTDGDPDPGSTLTFSGHGLAGQAADGDWVVRHPDGALYVYPPEVFAELFDPLD